MTGCGGDLGAFPASMRWHAFCASVFLTCLLWLRLRLSRVASRSDLALPDYGVGGHQALRDFSGFGLFFQAPIVLGYYLFRGRYPDLACLIQHEDFGFPLLPVIFAVQVILMVLLNLRRTASSGPVWDVATGVAASAPGARVLVLGAQRGLYAHAIAATAPGVQVVAADQYGSKEVPESSAWITENTIRAGLSDRVLVQAVDITNADLPFPDASFTHVYITYPQRLPHFGGDFHPHAEVVRAARLTALLREVRRVLIPGGRFFALNFSFSISDLESACAAAELGPVKLAKDRKIWVTFLPSVLVSVQVPGKPGSVASLNKLSPRTTAGLPDSPSAMGAQEYDHGVDDAALSASLLHRSVLMLPFILAYVILLMLTVANFHVLEAPAGVPFSNTFAALAVSTINFFPFVLYFQYLRMQHYVVENDSSDGLNAFAMKLLARLILGIFFWQLLTWLPSFALDLLLAGQSDGLLIAANVFYYTVLLSLAQYGWKKNNANKKKRLEQEAMAEPLLSAVDRDASARSKARLVLGDQRA